MYTDASLMNVRRLSMENLQCEQHLTYELHLTISNYLSSIFLSEFHSENFYPSFSSSFYIIEDTIRNYVLDAKLSMGKRCIQPMVCCRDFHLHVKDQQALSWE
jgi:hypothetical protein